jgi:hypothetical protein
MYEVVHVLLYVQGRKPFMQKNPAMLEFMLEIREQFFFFDICVMKKTVNAKNLFILLIYVSTYKTVHAEELLIFLFFFKEGNSSR